MISQPVSWFLEKIYTWFIRHIYLNVTTQINPTFMKVSLLNYFLTLPGQSLWRIQVVLLWQSNQTRLKNSQQKHLIAFI